MLVSALMPNYNHGHYLETKLTALLEAMPEESEIVIIDDASTDDSVSMIRKFAKQDQRIKFYPHVKNQGVLSSATELFNYAQGKYIFPTAADDVLIPTGMQTMISAMKRLPDASLYFAENGVIYEDGRMESYPFKDFQTAAYVSPKTLIRAIRQMKLSIPGQAVLLKREAVIRHGGYDPRLLAMCDWTLNHCIALTEGAVYVPCKLCYWRLHEGGQFSKTCLEDKRIASDMFTRYLEILSSKQLRRCFRRAAAIPGFFHPLIWESAKKNPRHLDLALTLLMQKIEHRGRRHRQSLKKLPLKLKNFLTLRS